MITGFLRRRILENPIVGRHLTATFTGPRLGSAVLFVGATLVCSYIALFALMSQSSMWMTRPAGALVWYTTTCVLYGLLVILVPLKIAGSIEGARIGKAFDQLVVTGASPLRIAAGSWWIGLFYTFVLLVVTLPFATCAWLFDGVTILQILRTYAVLLLYANVIIAVALAYSTYEREWISTPLLIAGFLLFGLLSWAPEHNFVAYYPRQLAEVSPIRVFWRELRPYEPMGPGPMMGFAALEQGVWLFGITIPISVWPWVFWAAIVGASVWLLACGPNHRFTPGLNNFGTVVLPGDRKRRFLRMMRPSLTRRVELAFLYENRAPWVARWEIPGKLLLSLAITVFIWASVHGVAFQGNYAVPLNRLPWDDSWMATFILSQMAFGTWILAWTDPNVRVYWRESLGRRTLPRELLLGIGFLIVLGVFLGLQEWTLGAILGSASVSGQAVVGSSDKLAETENLVLAFALFACSTFLTSRIVSRGTTSTAFNRVLVVFYVIATMLIPIGIFTATYELRGDLPMWLQNVAAFSPLFVIEDMPRTMLPTWSIERRALFFLLFHGGWTLFLLLWLVSLHWVRRRLERVARPRRIAESASTPAAAAVLLVLAILCTSKDRAIAQEIDETDARTTAPPAPVRIEAMRGFDGMVCTDDVDFATVILHNDSDKEIEGRIWAEAMGWREESRSVAVTIGPKTSRRLYLDLAELFVNPWTRQDKSPRHLIFATNDGRRSRRELTGLTVLETDCTPDSTRSYGDRFGIIVDSSADERREMQFAFVYVGDRNATPTAEWVQEAMGGQPSRFARITHDHVPLSFNAWEGVSAALFSAVELAQLDPSQIRALTDWVRLGGTVAVFGELEPTGIEAAGKLGELLRSERSETRAIGGTVFRIEEIAESRVTFDLADMGGAELPLVHARAFGAGSVAHISFDPGDLTVPAGIDARRFWREFSSRLPTSVFPLLPSWGSRVWWHDSHLHDFKSMGTISIYLGGYTILAASVLAFGLRKRERRRLVLPVLGAIALLAVVFVPILDAVLHRNPSYAESAEVTLVRAGAASTTTIGRLGIRSSGRQAHALRVDGQDARVWPLSLSRDYYSDGRAVGHLLPLVPPESTFADHALYRQRVPPWGRQDLLILRERAPVTELSGQATLIAPRSTSPTAKLFVRATLPDGVGSELAQLITVGLGDAESMLSSDGDRNNADDSRARLFWQTRLRPQNGREIHFEATVVRVVPRGGDNKNRIAVEVGTLLGNEVVFDWPTSRLPAVFVVCESPSDSDAFPPLVSSDDLRFVRRFSHPEHPLAEKSVDFRRHYLIFELPITEMAGR